MESRANEFVMQAREQLTELEQVLLSLEKGDQSETDRAGIDRCFRIVHSIKGDAGFLGLSTIRILANSMENALESIRERGLPVSAEAVERLLIAKDRLAALIDDIENSDRVELGEVLAELDKVESDAVPLVFPWVIDLRDIDRRRSGRLAEFFAGLEQCGVIHSSAIDLAPADLARELPQGSVSLRAHLSSGLPEQEIARILGLPVTSLGPTFRRGFPLTIDLAAWILATGQSLVRLLAALEGLGTLENAVVKVMETDLTIGLPAGPLILVGQMMTARAPEEVGPLLGLPCARQQQIEISAPIVPAQPLPALPAAPPAVLTVPPVPAVQKSSAQPPALESDKTSSLRISVELLDRLMTLTGELTLIRNQSLLASEHDDGPLRPIMQRLDAVTSELQETVLRTRMQPIGNLFGKFPRVVRDLGRQLGKQVDITIVGKEVELDKTILEQLSDPLTHLVRNSIDHGIEMPDDRVAKGKAPTGQVTLSASHEDGQVRIEIRDDGRGIDAQAVRSKALGMRLKTEAELDRMSQRELLGLILLPGFSTARQVTEVSGRGVGMDVVKTNIELLEGSLVIDSVPGLGTAMILRMPLTLAIIPCLIVAVKGERFAIPQRELEEAVCLHPGMAGRVEHAYDTEVYRLRDRLLPIVRLSDVLEERDPFNADTKAKILARQAESNEQSSIQYILVLRVLGRRFGLVVDEVRGTEEIVVKPLHPSIKRVGIFTGATIMGDGRIALIADVEGIVEHARLGFESTLEPSSKALDARKEAQAHRVLLFEYGPQEQFALPLLQIRRIEMIRRDRIERVGVHEYVTIDGASLRLLRLDHLVQVSAPDESQVDPSDQVSLILPKFGDQNMAILVSQIIDTELLAVDLQQHSEHDRGILGSAIVRGRLTLFLDLHTLTSKLFGRPIAIPDLSAPATSGSRRLLLIDDTPFFREVVKRYFVEKGHEIETAVDGKDALDKIAKSPPFDLIVSDIEMPVMDGWEFACEARRRGITTPLLALTSLSGDSYELKAKDCGFDAYEVKLDHDRLVRKVNHLLGLPTL